MTTNYVDQLDEEDKYKLGDSGAHIAELQKDLYRLWVDPGPIDGVYGEKTHNAVKAVQTNWYVTGQVDKSFAARIRRNAQALPEREPRKLTPSLNIVDDFIKTNYSSRGGYDPYMLIYHFTAVYSSTPIHTPTRNIFKNPNANVSAHYVIGYDGTVYYMVPEQYKAWHAGPSVHKGKYDCNPVSIGIELENWGPLIKNGSSFSHSAGSKYVYSDEFKKQVGNPVQISQDNYHWWMPYSEAQILAVTELSKKIVARHGIKRADCVGHRDISGPPVRGTRGYTGKMDPGPAFPMKKILDEVYS